MDEKLERLMARCKCTIMITINQHTVYYNPPEKYIEDAMGWDCPPDLSAEIRDEMIRRNNIVELSFWPDTPVGSYSIWDYSLDRALDRAMECLAERDE